MKNFILLLFFGVFQLGAQQTISPVLKECEKATDPVECSSEKWRAFENSVQATIEATTDFSMSDSLYIRFRVTKKGKVKVEESFALISKVTLMSVEGALKNKGVDLKPTNDSETYVWVWNIDIPDDFSAYESFYEVGSYPEMIECKSFNSVGRRGCSNYIIYKAEEELLDEGINEHARFKVFFKEGKAVALEAVKIPVSKTMADKVVLSVNQMMEKMATEGSRKRADDFYTYVDFEFKGDSLKRWEMRMSRLDYLKKIKSPEPFLREVLDVQRATFFKQREVGNRFLLGQLAEIDFDTKEHFRIGSFVYSLDSIRNYTFEEKDTAGIEDLDFAVVENKPLFKGCGAFKGDNDGAEKCFNRGMFMHVSKNFVFPETARRKGIQGKIYISFVIEKDGEIGTISILRGRHQLLDLECIRVISEIPKMDSPAIQRGKPVRMSFAMPINAKLQ